jgi:hypothetical protein
MVMEFQNVNIPSYNFIAPVVLIDAANINDLLTVTEVLHHDRDALRRAIATYAENDKDRVYALDCVADVVWTESLHKKWFSGWDGDPESICKTVEQCTYDYFENKQ